MYIHWNLKLKSNWKGCCMSVLIELHELITPSSIEWLNNKDTVKNTACLLWRITIARANQPRSNKPIRILTWRFLWEYNSSPKNSLSAPLSKTFSTVTVYSKTLVKNTTVSNDGCAHFRVSPKFLLWGRITYCYTGAVFLALMPTAIGW